MGISSSMNALSQAAPALIGGGIVAAHLSYPILLGAVCSLIAWLMFIKIYYGQLKHQQKHV
jgi:hypothetical protein